MRYTSLFILLIFVRGLFAQPSIQDKEYEIFNFILKKEFVEHGIDQTNGTKKQSFIIFGNGKPATTSNSNVHALSKEYIDITDSLTFSGFIDLNQNVYNLEEEKFSTKAYSKYKNTYVTVSRCYFNNDLAIVYLGVQYDLSEGEGYIYFLKYNKDSKSWNIVKKILQWIS